MRLPETILPLPPSAGSTDELSHGANFSALWQLSRQSSPRNTHQEASTRPQSTGLSAAEEQQFSWLGILAKNATFTAQTAATLWTCHVEEAELILQRWVDQQILVEKQWPQARLSPFAHIYQLPVALQQVAYSSLLQNNDLKPQEAHAALIERYQATTNKRLWHTLEDDGYIHAHLTWHLQAADCRNEIHILLQEEAESGANGWHEACDRKGYTRFFCRDVQLAWQLAEELYEQAPTLAIQLQCRYALTQVAHHRGMTAMPANLVAAFVHRQIWTSTQCITYLQLLPDARHQFEVLQKLIPVLPPSHHPYVFKVIQHQVDDGQKAQLLCTLASQLQGEQFRELLTIVEEMEADFYKALILREVAIRLPTDLLDQTMAIAQALAPGEVLVAACGIVARWPQTLSIFLPQLMQETKVEQEALSYAELLSTIIAISHLPLPQVQALLQNIQDDGTKTDLLIQLLPEHPQFLSQAFQAACTLPHERSCATALSKIAPYLSEIEVLLALKILDQFKDTSAARRALKSFSTHHPSSKICAKLLEIIESWSSELEQGQAYSDIFPDLPPSEQTKIKAQVSLFGSETARILTLCQLAVSDKTMFSSTLHHLSQCQEQQTQFKAYWILSQHWPKLLPAAFKAACQMDDSDNQVIAIHQLAPHLSDEQLKEVFILARQTKNQDRQRKLLHEIIPYCPPSLLQQIRTFLDQQQEHKVCAHLLGTLKAQCSSPPIRLSTWDARKQALHSLTSFLPEEMLSQTLTATFNFEDKTRSARSLSQLLPQIHPSQMDHDLWCKILRTLVHLEHCQFLEIIPKLLPIMSHLAGPEILHGTIQNVEMICRQW
ncbi:hypothetical protein [Acaryochloris sp. IP29b_bin.137]|uniref:hypothetical protein n=1 Tax=Acaryochloris sp. IP29b_bin.137 TaxID=2969217 RepID=UPI00262A8A39|nr:hypothetical protein [Acaryochloris sp. IP29b_bin.137]